MFVAIPPDLDTSPFHETRYQCPLDVMYVRSISTFFSGGDASIRSLSALMTLCSLSWSMALTLRPVSVSISFSASTFQGFRTIGFSQTASAPTRSAKRIWASCR